MDARKILGPDGLIASHVPMLLDEKAGEYGTWNAGVTWTPVSYMSVDVRYHDTDEHGLGATYDARYVAGVKFTKTF